MRFQKLLDELSKDKNEAPQNFIHAYWLQMQKDPENFYGQKEKN
jgi:hypothetical protein